MEPQVGVLSSREQVIPYLVFGFRQILCSVLSVKNDGRGSEKSEERFKVCVSFSFEVLLRHYYETEACNEAPEIIAGYCVKIENHCRWQVLQVFNIQLYTEEHVDAFSEATLKNLLFSAAEQATSLPLDADQMLKGNIVFVERACER